MKLTDTIAAVSTPRGKGGVALIRISGAEALAVAARVFSPLRGTPLTRDDHAKAVYGSILDAAAPKREPLDDGIATVFLSPRSFTGEDTVEISCHGGVLITERVLASVLCAGARHAEAGEFTRRAFLGGKLDLSEATALGDLLEAQNDNQLKLARSGMKGLLTDRSSLLYARLRSLLASLYAKIDFPDEDLAEMTPEQMRRTVSEVLCDTQALAATYRTGRAVNEGIKTVICGRPNVGKSSVYNRLAGYDAAIVTDIEGTTRDVLKETVSLGRVTLCLCDTAGLRRTADTVESIGIARARAEMAAAELILAVFDGSAEPTDEDNETLHMLSLQDAAVVVLINKADKPEGGMPALVRSHFPDALTVSAKSGEGFEALSERVDALFTDPSVSLGTDPIVANARQYAALVRTAEALTQVLDAMDNGLSQDLYCVDVELAMSALSELEGRQIGEEIVSEIFSKFCVGK